MAIHLKTHYYPEHEKGGTKLTVETDRKHALTAKVCVLPTGFEMISYCK